MNYNKTKNWGSVEEKVVKEVDLENLFGIPALDRLDN